METTSQMIMKSAFQALEMHLEHSTLSERYLVNSPSQPVTKTIVISLEGSTQSAKPVPVGANEHLRNTFNILASYQDLHKTTDYYSTALAMLACKKRWKSVEYRQAIMESALEQGIAWQIKINRQKRNLSQRQLAEMIESTQSAISRIEDPTYGRHRLETLVKIANAFDCALQVKLVPFSKLAIDGSDLSEEALFAIPYSEEVEQ
ncbi:helix-turn-helix domain-containing protein [Vogesella indigofera]|uniref:helix-turn-helix domain-containing protein n=1 Tax=Vogesella indigofera TaxID=45465 RepID=UPI00234CF987|nr:helix-turn-helix transcriptional regulator [Vogesella indigofera]MDC7704021.1 helix-turn-helix transcriptional regulator [Vogesella indigofera]